MSHKQEILLSVHIPKTGGTTFNNILHDIYQEHFILVKQDGIAEHVSTDVKNAVSNQAKDGHVSVIHGHYYLDPFRDCYPDAKLAVWLRYPIQRLLSNYYYSERSGVGMGCSPEELHNEDLIYKFVDQPHHHNTMTKMIGRSKIDEFAFIGITEDFEKSMALFSRIFSTKKAFTHKRRLIIKIMKFFKKNEIHVKHRNRNPDRKSPFYEISDELRTKILQLNRDDDALYQAGIARYQHLCSGWFGE
jgi:hypothetical protein